MSLSTGTVVFEDATLKAVELVAETMTLNNFSVSSTTSLQQATNTGNVTTNTVEFTNPTTAFVTTANVEVGTANFFVDTTTSNIGIGTTTPEYTLDVHGTANIWSLSHGLYYSSSNEGYTSLGNNTVLIWGRVAQSVTTAGQYNWTFNFPNSLTLDSILHSAVGSISDPVRGLSYHSDGGNRISALGINGFFTNKVSGHIKTDDVSDGTITICLMIIGTKA